MPKQKPYVRQAWADRFNRPTIEELRSALRREDGAVFDDARRRLLEIDDIREEFAWHGENWRWTIEYRTAHTDAPLVVLVPSPTDLQLAIPLDPEFVRSLPLRRMKRAIRDGLDLAAEPFDTHWGIWSLQSGALLGDLEDLIARKLQHLCKRAG